jgi:tetratricopeptide (TPR) repeat protein
LDLLKEAHRLLDQGRFPDAERAYQKILARDIGNPEALTHLGNIAFQRGDVDRALSYYDEALRRGPQYGHALWDKGIALRSQGDNAGAIAAWEAFARLYPADSQDVITVKQWIAEAQTQLGSGKAVSLPEEMIRKLSKMSEPGVAKEKAIR